MISCARTSNQEFPETRQAVGVEVRRRIVGARTVSTPSSLSAAIAESDDLPGLGRRVRSTTVAERGDVAELDVLVAADAVGQLGEGHRFGEVLPDSCPHRQRVGFAG